MKQENKKQSVARNLKRLRRAKGYRSASAFAVAHAIPIQTYLNHESGKRGITLQALFGYASLFNCSVDKILHGQDLVLRAYIAGVSMRSAIGNAMDGDIDAVALSYNDYLNDKIGLSEPINEMLTCVENIMPSVIALKNIALAKMSENTVKH